MMFIAVPLVWGEPAAVSIMQDAPVYVMKTQHFIPPVVVPPPVQIPASVLNPPSPEMVGLYGEASWYSETDPYINLHTANGEIFDDTKMTCASWDYSFGTELEVTNLKNGKSVVCVVNDRGPAKRLNRVIDLTKAAFREISETRRGLIQVFVKPVKQKQANAWVK